MIYVANDHAGYKLGMALYEKMLMKYLNVYHLGCASTASTDYPLFAHRVAEQMKAFESNRGILVCGSGVGMSIAANRHSHIRAALVERPGQARYARLHNGINVLCLSGNRLTLEDAWPIVKAFLFTDADEDERHRRRRRMLNES